jgi:serine protease Do
MIKASAFSILVFFLLLASPPLFADNESSQRLCPLPMVEAEKILFDWLVDSGFDVSKTSPERDQIFLLGLKGSESWEMILRPYSPLASYLRMKYTVNGQPQQGKLDELWAYLEGYSRGQRSERKDFEKEVPPKVLSQSQSVVCIKAKVEQGEIQFSGFIVDKKGLIVSTAHDLKDAQEISAILHNGQKLKGDLVKIDYHRDLILIDIKYKLNSSVSLKGRKLLKNGEKVYSIGYPFNFNYQRMVHFGIIDGPPRSVDHLPLWKVEMETLPGSSGGPVFDAQGNLVAIVKGRYRGTETVGFLIPLDTILEFLREK